MGEDRRLSRENRYVETNFNIWYYPTEDMIEIEYLGDRSKTHRLVLRQHEVRAVFAEELRPEPAPKYNMDREDRKNIELLLPLKVQLEAQVRYHGRPPRTFGSPYTWDQPTLQIGS